MELASELTERLTEVGVAETSKKAIPDEDLPPEKYLAEVCKECEDPLPEFRKKKGLVICTSCQAIHEYQEKRKL